ncbi:MAG: helix-turn-helix domain-containing protein [Acidobacteria bacterium]|nr:helix-turn-helix domain-containing protein [Acidobacteriota bacterium]
MKKDTFTANEAAQALGVSSARVRQMVLDGSLPASRFGRALVISAQAIEAARERKTQPGPAPAPRPKASGTGGRVKVKKGSKR